MKITDISVEELQEKLKKGEITVKEVAENYLKRIKEDEDARVEAFITVDEEDVLNQAEKLDKKLKSGERIGKLFGVPIAIKDNISVKDIKMTCGSKSLENYIPPFDATIIERIKEEDGLIIGKTNLDEFAAGSSTEGSYYGATINPVNKTRVAGGSSGGSAAAVGSNQAVLSLGTDTGGSVRQPAAFSNVVGIKPSYGLVSRYGVMSMASSLDHVGVFGRDVKDAALLLGVIGGKDERDSTTYPKGEELLSNLDLDSEYDLKGKKIAYPKEVAEGILDEEIKERMDVIINIVEKLGGEVEEISIPMLKYAPACYHIISTAELSSSMGRIDGIIYGYRAEEYEDLDELYINTRTESLGAEVKRRIMFGNYVLSEENREEYYFKGLKVRRLLKDALDEVLEDYDFIISPTSPLLPFPLGEGSKDTKIQYSSDMFTVPANLAGVPAISIPAGTIEDLPFGVQLTGRQYGDRDLIKDALAMEGGISNEL